MILGKDGLDVSQKYHAKYVRKTFQIYLIKNVLLYQDKTSDPDTHSSYDLRETSSKHSDESLLSHSDPLLNMAC